MEEPPGIRGYLRHNGFSALYFSKYIHKFSFCLLQVHYHLCGCTFRRLQCDSELLDVLMLRLRFREKIKEGFSTHGCGCLALFRPLLLIPIM